MTLKPFWDQMDLFSWPEDNPTSTTPARRRKPQPSVTPSTCSTSKLHDSCLVDGKATKKSQFTYVLSQALCGQLVKRWRERLPIDPDRPNLGTWLEWSTEKEGAGCAICYANKAAGAWANYRIRTRSTLQLCHALAHASTEGHQRATQKMLGLPVEKKINAPSEKHFNAVLDDRKRGVSVSQVTNYYRTTFPPSKIIECKPSATKVSGFRGKHSAGDVGLT